METRFVTVVLAGVSFLFTVNGATAEDSASASTYRRFQVEETDGRVVAMTPIPDAKSPLWARDVVQAAADWSGGPGAEEPYFAGPIPFVLPPEDAGEPFHSHNHQPSITWLNNGDLLAIWYSTVEETGTELTVLASRFRAGSKAWDPSSEFFKVPNRNMHGCSLFHDGKGTVYHFNGMAPDGGRGWARLALLLRPAPTTAPPGRHLRPSGRKSRAATKSSPARS